MNIQDKINFHTHTTFCDGKNSPEEMILSAIDKGFTVLGFSGHSTYPLLQDFYIDYEENWHMTPAAMEEYTKTIRELAQKYSDKIKILLGFEADYINISSKIKTNPDKNIYAPFNPDFLIGSVHFVSNQKGFYTVDADTQTVKNGLETLYKNGQTNKVDGKAAVCDYFEAQRKMLEKGNFDVWGHPDLIRKRNGELNFFDENDTWYKEELQATAKAAAKAGIVAEINTGAIGRKVMTDAYPSDYFLELLYNANVPVCINSDSHSAQSLDCAYDLAAFKAKKAGYKELIYPCKSGNFIVKL